MQGSIADVIWTVCYLSVLIGLSGYGLHRYFIVYLFLKNRDRPPHPLAQSNVNAAGFPTLAPTNTVPVAYGPQLVNSPPSSGAGPSAENAW